MAAGVDNVLSGDVVEHLYDGTDEGVLGVMGGPISVSLSHTPYKKVQGIDIRAARRPYFLLPEVRQIGPEPILPPVGIVSRCSVFLPHIWPTKGHTIHPGMIRFSAPLLFFSATAEINPVHTSENFVINYTSLA